MVTLYVSEKIQPLLASKMRLLRLIQTRYGGLHFPQWAVAFPQTDWKCSISALTQSTAENADRSVYSERAFEKGRYGQLT